MRIIAKHDDVYDLQHSMSDDTRVWVREEETFQVRMNKDTENLIRRFQLVDQEKTLTLRADHYILAKPMMIAGEIHWMYDIRWYDRERVSGELYAKFRTFDIDKVKEKLDELELDVRDRFGADAVKGIDGMQQKLKDLAPTAWNLLRTLNRPLAFVNGVTKSETDETFYFEVITNFNLHQRKFPWQEIEPNLYRLHQVLESYIWGVIGTGEKQVVEISDLDRLKAHGFDEKISFRTRK